MEIIPAVPAESRSIRDHHLSPTKSLKNVGPARSRRLNLGGERAFHRWDLETPVKVTSSGGFGEIVGQARDCQIRQYLRECGTAQEAELHLQARMLTAAKAVPALHHDRMLFRRMVQAQDIHPLFLVASYVSG